MLVHNVIQDVRYFFETKTDSGPLTGHRFQKNLGSRIADIV
jgi:hypothetical protein